MKRLIVLVLSMSLLSTNITGQIRGVAFHFLDNGVGIPVLMATQDNPDTAEKLCNTFTAYQAAGVNWVRVLVVAWFYLQYEDYQDIYTNPAPYITQVNTFMERANQCGDFKFEIVLDPRLAKGGWFTDQIPFNNDKAWLSAWIAGLDKDYLGGVMISGDLNPCGWDGTAFSCYGDGATQVHPQVYNHGYWIKTVYPYIQAQFPGVLINYEMKAGDQANDNELMLKSVAWSETFTPSTPYNALALNFMLESGKTWEDYRDRVLLIVQRYKQATNKPLWIDEFSAPVCVPAGCGTPQTNDDYTWQDQSAALNGWLAALTCFSSDQYPKFFWAADKNVTLGYRSFGMIASWNGNTPVFKGTWGALSTYYNLSQCP